MLYSALAVILLVKYPPDKVQTQQILWDLP